MNSVLDNSNTQLDAAEIAFMHAVQALAQDGTSQCSLFPEFACVGDELAIAFEEAQSGLSERSRNFTVEQAETLSKLDGVILRESGEHNSQFWLDRIQLIEHPCWDEIRVAAAAVLVAFGWPAAKPPVDGGIYVSADKVESNTSS